MSLSALGFIATQTATPVQAQTTATYQGTVVSPQTSNTVKAQAIFTIINGTTLQIDLSNIGAATTNKADVLSTVLFNFGAGVMTTGVANGTANLTTGLLGVSTVINSNTGLVTTSQAVNGSFVFGKQIDADRRYDYGISSSGFSRPPTTASAIADGTEVYGFSGFGLGSGSDDYSLIGGPTTTINGGNSVLVKTGVRLTVTGFTGLTSTSQINNVGFGFNSGALTTGGNYLIASGVDTSATPEPGVLALIASAGILCVPAKLRKKRRSVK